MAEGLYSIGQRAALAGGLFHGTVIILLIGSGVVDKTSFSVPALPMGERRAASGRILVNGMVHGRISGTVHGILRATVDGDVDLTILSGAAEEEGKEAAPHEEE